MPRSRIASSGCASRAAASASNDEIDAVSVVMPNHPSPNPSIWRNQSVATCSSSVAAGDVFHNIAFTSSAATNISARIPGTDDDVAK
jgi:hypothetical protein